MGLLHKLFRCPTFWCIKPAFKCPECGKTYRCYWDGNDIADRGINICNSCAPKERVQQPGKPLNSTSEALGER